MNKEVEWRRFIVPKKVEQINDPMDRKQAATQTKLT